MKSWLAVAIAASMLAGSASAQLAPELLGEGSSTAPMYSEPVYKGPEGLWVLARERADNGYHCSVNFITRQNTFSLRGPADAEMARRNIGAIWFISSKIPPVAKAETVPIILSSTNYPTRTVRAAHTSLPGQSDGAILLLVNIQASLKEKPDSNEMAVQLGDQEVFRTKLVQLQAAYRALGRCMSAAKK